MVLIRNEQDPGDRAYQQVINRIRHDALTLRLGQQMLGRIRGFIREYVPDIENEQRQEIDLEQLRLQQNNRDPARPNMRAIVGQMIAVIYEGAGELERETEVLQNELGEIRDWIEQQEQMRRLSRFQRDLDEDRHLGGF